LPSAKNRWPHFVQPEPAPGVLEPQFFHYETGDKWDIGSFKTDKLRDGDKLWLNSDFLRGMKMAPGDKLVMDFDTTAPMSGEGALVVTVGGDYGKVALSLDGKLLANYDGHAADLATRTIKLPSLAIKAGHHKMTLEIPKSATGAGSGPGPESTNWGIDYLRVGGQPLPVENASETSEGTAIKPPTDNQTTPAGSGIRIDEL
jgi:hypothetical protein